MTHDEHIAFAHEVAAKVGPRSAAHRALSLLLWSHLTDGSGEIWLDETSGRWHFGASKDEGGQEAMHVPIVQYEAPPPVNIVVTPHTEG